MDEPWRRPMQPRADAVKVLVIDDSTTMRRLLRHVLSSDPRVIVVAEAADAAEGLEQLRLHRPDVVTLDVEMPGLSGLEFLDRMMRQRPIPVVMVSSETQRGSAAAVAALALGAVDCIGKPRNPAETGAFDALVEAVVAAASANVIRRRPVEPAAPVPRPTGAFRWNGRAILIGASTGGVEALGRVLEAFPADCPPTVIVQHMPASFLASFSARLDAALAPAVALAQHGTPLRQGHILFAPGGDYHLGLNGSLSLSCSLLADDKRNGHRPSVDVTFDSALPAAQTIVAAILTGMGRDGADGLLRLRQAGARTLAQDEASSVVWGMPGSAWANGGAEELVPLDRIGPRLLEICARGCRGAEVA